MKQETSQRYIKLREREKYDNALRKVAPLAHFMHCESSKEEHSFTGRKSRGRIGFIGNRGGVIYNEI